MSCFYLFISVLYVYLHLFYEFQSLKLKKLLTKNISKFKIRINLENINNSFRKTNSERGVKVEKNRAREEIHRVGKVNLYYILVYYYHLRLNFYKLSVGTSLHTFVPTFVPGFKLVL